MPETIAIPRQFRGPAQSANGGYTCGIVAELVAADAVEVTLRRPPPLDVALSVEREPEGVVRVVVGGDVVAEARPAVLDLELPVRGPAFEEAERLSQACPDDPAHPFPGCFVCGPDREPGDGLRLHPAPAGDGTVVAAWRVEQQFAGARFAWAALDCPGGWAVEPDFSRGVSVLGRLTARILEPPCAGDACVVLGWPLGTEGRKRHAGTAIYRDGELLAYGRAVWIGVSPAGAAGAGG